MKRKEERRKRRGKKGEGDRKRKRKIVASREVIQRENKRKENQKKGKENLKKKKKITSFVASREAIVKSIMLTKFCSWLITILEGFISLCITPALCIASSPCAAKKNLRTLFFVAKAGL